MSILKIICDINCVVKCDFHEVGNIQIGELFKLQLKKGCYILEFLVEDIVICSMDYTIETNDEEPLLRLNIKKQAEKKIMEQKFIRNKSTKVNIYLDDDRFILDCESNNPVVVPKEYDLYYKSVDGNYIEDEAGFIPFLTSIVEEIIQNGETTNDIKILYGSLNKLGEIVIEPNYSTPIIFYNSEIAKTTRNKCLIHINHFGEEVALSYLNTEEFEITAPFDKDDNLFIAKSIEDESCLGVVRYDKKIIVVLSNKTIYKNTGDYIWALKGDTLSIYNNEGKWIRSIHSVDLGEIELRYGKHQDYVFIHKEAVAVRVSGYWGLYDFDGNVIIPHIYEMLDAIWSDYTELPFMFVKKRGGGYGIININVLDETDGIFDVNNIKELIPCQYDAIYSNDGKRIEELKGNFFLHSEQDDDGQPFCVGIGDDIFFVKFQGNLMECNYFEQRMVRFGAKDKEEHFVCKEFNKYHYIDEDGNLHLRGKNRDKSSIDKEELINTSRHALIYSEDGRTIINCDKSFEGELVVPKGVEHIAESAFNSCKAISIHISDSVTSIGCNAFRNSRSLTSITIPNSVTSIGDYALAYCTRLTSITIPNSVTSIGERALAYCTRLTSVRIGNSVTSIGFTPFLECCELTDIVVEEGNIMYDSRNNCNAIIEKSSNVLIAGCKNTKIPNSVTNIGNCAFAYCYGLTSVRIPNSVTYIGVSAFEYCGGLTSVAIPNSVTCIGDHAFERCECLTSIIIPNSVMSIGYGAFRCCHSLTSITIPNSVTCIGDNAFEFCSGLTSITIPNSVTRIGRYAFRCCRSLSSITIPNSVMSIGDGVFRDCDKLKEIIISKGTRKKFEEMLPDQKDKLVEYEQLSIKRTKDNRTFFFFDTETTGVPLNYKAPSSDTNNWPRLVQLAWILTDEEGNRIHTGNLIVKPEGFIIPTDATKVHSITTQRANEEGVPLAEAIEQFKADLDVATYIVGHNVDFDKKIVGAEMIRLKMKDELEKKKSYCTMQSSIDFCKIPSKYGYKYPKLQELYKKLFGCEFDNAHDAMSDIEATEKCFWELRKRKLI
jgi:DNA polymerase III epsilon subunit-like protein